MAERTPLYMDINDVYSGDELGLPYRDLVSEGVVSATSLEVTQNGGGGGDLTVNLAAGSAWVLGDTDTVFQPCYRIINDAVVNKGISPDPSNPRKVLVVAQVTDQAFAGSGRTWAITAIHGTPAASPVEPALPASALPLALIDVTAGDTGIATAQITDRRFRAGFGDRSLIWDKKLTAAAASIDIPNIPARFAHLELLIYGRGDDAGTNVAALLRFNNDSGANYDGERVLGSAAAASIVETLAGTSMRIGVLPAAGATASRAGMSRVDIPDYLGTTFHKTLVALAGGSIGTTSGNIFVESDYGSWRSTSAIDRLTALLSAGNFAAGTRVSLYGVRG